MQKLSNEEIEELFGSGEEIDRAMRRAVRKALLRHKKLGNPIAVWRDGKVVWLQPDEIVVDSDDEEKP